MKNEITCLILILGIIFLSLSSVSALTINTTSFNVNSIHLGSSGTGNISTTSYTARDTITYQQASTSNLQTTSYTANSGWFFVESTSVGEVNITEIFFSNESVFNFSNVFNQSEITYNMTLEYIGANCTAITGNVVNVTFSLFNTEDNTSYINTTGYTYRFLNESGNLTDLYILNASYQIRDSGNWTLNVSCFASGGGLTDKDSSIWEILWGNLTINLVQPLIDTSVQIYEFFTFSANVSCSGGECGIVSVTLDPEDINLTEEIEETSTEEPVPEEIPSNETTELQINETIEEVNDTTEFTLNETIGNETFVEIPLNESISESEESNESIETPSNETSSEESNESREEEPSPHLDPVPLPEINETEIPETNETTVESFEMKLNINDKEARIVFSKNVSIINQAIIIPEIIDENLLTITNLENETEFEYLTPILALELENESSATVYLPKLKNKSINVIRKCDDWNFVNNSGCNSEWYVYTLVDEGMQNDSFVWFDVDSFSAYAGGNLTASETAFLTIWDYNDVGMPNASVNTTDIKIANETIQFFADYELARNGTKIIGGDCSISFSDVSGNMTYNSTYTYYLYERNFTSNGLYTYTVSCTSSTYTNLNASDSIVIGGFSNATKGAISTIVGDVPFYTTSANPQQILSLKGGETQTLTWSVNATGILNKVYDFFVEAFGYITFNYTANASNNGSDYYPINISSLVNSTHVNLQITANDTTDPVFVSKTIIPAAVINGSSTIINADVSDNIQVDGIWANITLPDNSTEFISPGNLPYTFTNTSQVGTYTVVFYSNDTSGNNATTTKTFQVALPANLTMNVSVSVDIAVNVSTNVNFIAYVSGTKDIIEERLNITGSASIQLPNIPVDLFFDSTFNNSNLLTTLFEFNLSDNANNSIAFGNPTLSEFLVTYGIETDFNFTNAQAEFFYSGTSFSNEDNLQLHKCDSFTISTGTCTSGFNDITSDSKTTQDKDNNKFTYNATSFSGFGIKEVTPSTTPTTTTTTGGGGGGGGCASGYKKIGLKCVKVAEEEIEEVEEGAIPSQLFDISLSLDDSLIQSSDELSAVVTFESFGTVPTPINLTFIILDESGNEYAVDKDFIVVITEEIFRKKFEALYLPDGKYTLVLQTLYNVDVFDEFRQEFEVGKERRGITGRAIDFVKGEGKWWLSGIVGVILIIVLILLSTKKVREKRKKGLKRRMKMMRYKLPKNKIIVIRKKRKIRELGKKQEEMKKKSGKK